MMRMTSIGISRARASPPGAPTRPAPASSCRVASAADPAPGPAGQGIYGCPVNPSLTIGRYGLSCPRSIHGRPPLCKGLFEASGRRSWLLPSIRPSGAALWPLASMRSADQRPIMRTSSKLVDRRGLCWPRSDRSAIASSFALAARCRGVCGVRRHAARYAAPRLSIAQTIRASLLATAATTTLNGRRARKALIHAHSRPVCPGLTLTRARAPWIS